MTKATQTSSASKSKEIKKILELGVQRGFLTFEEINDLLPQDILDPTKIDDIMNLLAENDIDVVDSASKKAKDDDDSDGDDAPEAPDEEEVEQKQQEEE